MRSIGAVVVDGTFYYVSPATYAGWGAAGCPNAANLVIYRSQPGARELLSLVLAAKAGNKQLMAYGTCNASYPDAFFYVGALYMY